MCVDKKGCLFLWNIITLLPIAAGFLAFFVACANILNPYYQFHFRWQLWNWYAPEKVWSLSRGRVQVWIKVFSADPWRIPLRAVSGQHGRGVRGEVLCWLQGHRLPHGVLWTDYEEFPQGIFPDVPVAKATPPIRHQIRVSFNLLHALSTVASHSIRELCALVSTQYCIMHCIYNLRRTLNNRNISAFNYIRSEWKFSLW